MTEHPKMQYQTPELIARLGLDYFRGSVLSLITKAASSDNAEALYKEAETLCLQAYEFLQPTTPTLSNNFTSYELELYASANNLTHALKAFKALMGNDWAITLTAVRQLRK